MEIVFSNNAAIISNVFAFDFNETTETLVVADGQSKLSVRALNDISSARSLALAENARAVRLSPDGRLVAAIMENSAKVEVRSLVDAEWEATLKDWVKAVDLHWALCCTKLIVVSQFGAKVTICDLVEGGLSIIPNVRSARRSVALASTMNVMAVLVMPEDNVERVELVCLSTKASLGGFKTRTRGAEELCFGAGDRFIAVREEFPTARIGLFQLDGAPLAAIAPPNLLINCMALPAGDGWPLAYATGFGELCLFHARFFHAVCETSIDGLLEDAKRAGFVALSEVLNADSGTLEKKRSSWLSSCAGEVQRQTLRKF